MSTECQTDSPTKMHDSATKMRHTDIAKSDSVVILSTISRDDLFKLKRDKYPFLEANNPRLKMYDTEIIDRDIIFAHTPLNVDQQKQRH